VITTKIKKARLENLAIDQKLENIDKIILQAMEKVIPLKEKSIKSGY